MQRKRRRKNGNDRETREKTMTADTSIDGFFKSQIYNTCGRVPTGDEYDRAKKLINTKTEMVDILDALREYVAVNPKRDPMEFFTGDWIADAVIRSRRACLNIGPPLAPAVQEHRALEGAVAEEEIISPKMREAIEFIQRETRLGVVLANDLHDRAKNTTDIKAADLDAAACCAGSRRRPGGSACPQTAFLFPDGPPPHFGWVEFQRSGAPLQFVQS